MTKIFNVVTIALIFLGLFAVSCEEDFTNDGGDMLDTGASGNLMFLDLISYNTNTDSIRSDQKMLQSAILGAYQDNVFGTTKAKFLSQVRLGTLNPSFGTNATVDSVVLNVPVYYNSTAISTDTLYSVNNSWNETKPDDFADDGDILIKKLFKVDSIYGDSTALMHLTVKEVNTFMYSIDSSFYSNPLIGTSFNANWNNFQSGNILGSNQISNRVTNITKKKYNGTSNDYSETVGYKIRLDNSFFQQRIIQNATSLTDQATFIRNVLKGIELSVDENNGYFFNFKPNSMSFTMYYHYDNPVSQTEGQEDYEPTLTSTLVFNTTSFWGGSTGLNTQVAQFSHENRSAIYNNAFNSPDVTNGASRLYLSGLDGTKSVLKIKADQLENLRTTLHDNDWQIVGAELRLYVDDSYNFPKPKYLFAWNQYTSEGKVKNDMFKDLSNFYQYYPSNVQFNPIYKFSSNPGYYTIRITEHLKNIIEKDSVFEDQKIILNIGNFLLDNTNQASIYSGNPMISNRAFNPYRIVLHGNLSENEEKKLKLAVYYTKKH